MRRYLGAVGAAFWKPSTYRKFPSFACVLIDENDNRALVHIKPEEKSIRNLADLQLVKRRVLFWGFPCYFALTATPFLMAQVSKFYLFHFFAPESIVLGMAGMAIYPFALGHYFCESVFFTPPGLRYSEWVNLGPINRAALNKVLRAKLLLKDADNDMQTEVEYKIQEIKSVLPSTNYCIGDEETNKFLERCKDLPQIHFWNCTIYGTFWRKETYENLTTP